MVLLAFYLMCSCSSCDKWVRTCIPVVCVVTSTIDYHYFIACVFLRIEQSFNVNRLQCDSILRIEGWFLVHWTVFHVILVVYLCIFASYPRCMIICHVNIVAARIATQLLLIPIGFIMLILRKYKLHLSILLLICEHLGQWMIKGDHTITLVPSCNIYVLFNRGWCLLATNVVRAKAPLSYFLEVRILEPLEQLFIFFDNHDAVPNFLWGEVVCAYLTECFNLLFEVVFKCFTFPYLQIDIVESIWVLTPIQELAQDRTIVLGNVLIILVFRFILHYFRQL